MFDLVNSASEAVLEKFFIQILDPFDREDLDEAVEADVSLLDETAKDNPGALTMAEGAAKRFRGQAHILTIENVLMWTKSKRYELYFAFVSDKKAYNWLDRQISEFRAYLFE